jgi:hypothetical protein
MVPRAALRVIVDPRPQIIASSERSGHFLEARPAGLEPPTYGFEGQILMGAPECSRVQTAWKAVPRILPRVHWSALTVQFRTIAVRPR